MQNRNINLNNLNKHIKNKKYNFIIMNNSVNTLILFYHIQETKNVKENI